MSSKEARKAKMKKLEEEKLKKLMKNRSFNKSLMVNSIKDKEKVGNQWLGIKTTTETKI